MGHHFLVIPDSVENISHWKFLEKKIVKFPFFQTLSHKNAIKKVEGVKNWQKFGPKWTKNGRNLAEKVAILANFCGPNGENHQNFSGNTDDNSLHYSLKRRPLGKTKHQKNEKGSQPFFWPSLAILYRQ